MKTINGINFYTAHEAAERLGYCYDTLLRHIRAGRIAVVKRGRASFITQEAIDKFLTSSDDKTVFPQLPPQP